MNMTWTLGFGGAVVTGNQTNLDAKLKSIMLKQKGAKARMMKTMIKSLVESNASVANNMDTKHMNAHGTQTTKQMVTFTKRKTV